MQIPRVSSSTAQPPEQGHNRHQAQPAAENFEIPKLEENSEEEQFADFDSFMAHHNELSIYSKNIFPIYKIWTMTNIMPKLTERTFLSIHRLHNTIGQHTTKKLHGNPWKNSKEYLEEAEVKPDKKSYTATGHLALVPILCKATFSTRSRRISVYVKGTLPIINISIL